MKVFFRVLEGFQGLRFRVLESNPYMHPGIQLSSLGFLTINNLSNLFSVPYESLWQKTQQCNGT